MAERRRFFEGQYWRDEIEAAQREAADADRRPEQHRRAEGRKARARQQFAQAHDLG